MGGISSSCRGAFYSVLERASERAVPWKRRWHAGPWEHRARARASDGTVEGCWVALPRCSVWNPLAAQDRPLKRCQGVAAPSVWPRQPGAGGRARLAAALPGAYASQEGRVKFGPWASRGCCPGSRMGRSPGLWHGRGWPAAQFSSSGRKAKSWADSPRGGGREASWLSWEGAGRWGPGVAETCFPPAQGAAEATVFILCCSLPSSGTSGGQRGREIGSGAGQTCSGGLWSEPHHVPPGQGVA